MEEIVKAVVKKKRGPGVLLWMLIIVLVAAIAFVGTCWYQVSKNPLPEFPEKVATEEELYETLTKGIILAGNTTFSTEDLNGALEITRKSANKALKAENVAFSIEKLYGELENSELICYMVAKDSKRTYNITVRAELDFSAPKALIYVSEVKLGNLKLPVNMIMNKVANYPMPKNVTVEGRRLIFDTSELNDLLIETARKNQTVSNVEGAISGILSIFGVDFELEDVIEFKITDLYIRDGKLTMKSDLFKDKK